MLRRAAVLDVSHDRLGDTVVVHVVGEVDMASVAVMKESLLDACADAGPSGRVVADLTGVTFFGSTGLAVLAEAYSRCDAAGVTFTVAASGSVLRILRIVGLADLLGAADAAP